ncbi:hypothetical protein GH714_021458 [Hevea brasiliensis]|uniref:Integrase catalytic domain-containing protein n=1 Tax=Hevea brasiliensis TaxID=3981 RepID=A0A6A6LVR7_HEVBR|nr:hypothetical protein GH714_021458 [Hevea brasiliensis]
MADALSQRDEEQCTLMAISQPIMSLLEAIRAEINNTDSLSQLWRQVEDGELGSEWSCFVGDKPTNLVDWLPWAEYCYNTSFHSALHTTPFQVVYGREPPKLLTYDSGSSRVDAVDKALLDRDSILVDIRQRLQQAQQCMKTYYDKVIVMFSLQLLIWFGYVFFPIDVFPLPTPLIISSHPSFMVPTRFYEASIKLHIS